MKKNILLSLIVVLAAGTVGFFLITKNTTKTNFLSLEYVQIAEPVTEKTIEEKISQFGGVVDHKINKIEFIADNAGFVSDSGVPSVEFLKSLFPKDIDKSFIVKMHYSIKLDKNSSQQIRDIWIAGNGEAEKDGWINNKSVYVRIDKTPGGYVSTILGTGI